MIRLQTEWLKIQGTTSGTLFPTWASAIMIGGRVPKRQTSHHQAQTHLLKSPKSGRKSPNPIPTTKPTFVG